MKMTTPQRKVVVRVPSGLSRAVLAEVERIILLLNPEATDKQLRNAFKTFPWDRKPA